MSQANQTLNDFRQYLGGTGLSPGTAEQYVKVLQNILSIVKDPDDLRSPMMLGYARWQLKASYQPMYGSVWKAFRSFCATKQIDLPVLEELRRIRLAHPIGHDMYILFGKFYSGLPKGLTWQDFLAQNPDQKLQFAALRAYTFFTGEASPMGNQPLIARGPASLEPVPEWVLESIYESRQRTTTGSVEILHKDVTALLTEYRAPVRVSIDVYKAFAAGAATIRKKAGSARDLNYEKWEKLAMIGEFRTLMKDVRAYANVKEDDMELITIQ